MIVRQEGEIICKTAEENFWGAGMVGWGGLDEGSAFSGPIRPDRGLIPPKRGPEFPRSPTARDRGHPQCGFGGVETEATRRGMRMLR
jgi:hypothetical protein